MISNVLSQLCFFVYIPVALYVARLLWVGGGWWRYGGITYLALLFCGLAAVLYYPPIWNAVEAVPRASLLGRLLDIIILGAPIAIGTAIVVLLVRQRRAR